jgi:predicted enzyme related to lactoylglutathione lyase
MQAAVSRVILYVKDVRTVSAFYQRHFAMTPLPGATDEWMELSGGAGCNIALHKAAKSQKSGAAIKISFGVADVAQFKRVEEAKGLVFGPIHDLGEFSFANAKDPAGNSIQISSRGVAATR